MRTNITGRRIEITDAIRQYVEKKTSRLSKYYNRISDIEVVIDLEGLQHTIEVILKVDHAHRFVVRESGEDLYACIDKSMDKVERQLTRRKERSRTRKGRVGTSQATSDFLEAQAEEEA
ncbi:MAG: ribosome-associated translation inhibitor RaiA [Planctomycetes bacterium]|nr:ribosome-associated translation inhibitor RaiA [Planctomycetota bacterium]